MISVSGDTRGEMYLKFETGRGGEEKATTSPLLERGEVQVCGGFGRKAWRMRVTVVRW
jgi:alkylated DNA repair dioxygenase AlkB